MEEYWNKVWNPIISIKFRGAAHKKCNRNYRIPNFIPVYFHNLSGYDSHLFIKKIKTNIPTEYHIKVPSDSKLKSETGEEWVTYHVPSEGDINCIPKTEENYTPCFKKKHPLILLAIS